jgi:tRNA threonylcarbamoyladenosine modification (KEOPS) complex Cgi121 subunit
MNVVVKGVVFKNFDLTQIKNFLHENPKTQIVSVGSVCGKKHALHSINQTLKAFAAQRNLAKQEEIEFLLRLSGQRQIERALCACTPKKRSVFISWSGKAQSVYSTLKREFDVQEVPTKESPKAELKAAMEKTTTFWLD